MILKIHESKWNTGSLIRLRNFLAFTSLIGIVNHSVLSEPMLRLIWRWDLLLSFCFEEDFECEDVLLKIALLDEIFKVLSERLALRNLMSLVFVKWTVIFGFETNRVMYLGLQTTHTGLTLDGLEDVLDQELQRDEVVGYLVGSRLVLLRVRRWLLLESALPMTLKVNRGVSMLRLRFCPVVVTIERWVGGAFHCILQLDEWLGLV